MMIKNKLFKIHYLKIIEDLLFDAYKEPQHIHQALRASTFSLSADAVFLSFKSPDEALYLWNRSTFNASHAVHAVIDYTNSHFLTKKAVYYKKDMPAYFADYNIKHLILIPIMDKHKNSIGVLGSLNSGKRHADALLESSAVYFSRTVQNLIDYRALWTKSAYDALTGLCNANSYYSRLKSLEQSNNKDSLACIYIDANGLHEINNFLGHQAGDQMLMTVADALKAVFPAEDCYRIGGDEFVVLCQGYSKEAVIACIRKVRNRLLLQKYEISIGMAWQNTSANIDQMILDAEEKMREDKKRYYHHKGNMRQSRELNRQLEQFIIEKEDADTFLSIISPSFKGVYFVNLSTDNIRDIFIPDYFETMLEKSEGKFSKAIAMYCDEIVAPEFARAFERFCCYRTIEGQLDNDITPELIYRKKDGTAMRLKVLKFKNYGSGDRETLWIFTPEDPDGI